MSAARTVSYERRGIEVSFDHAQDVAELLKGSPAGDQTFVIENFHYLSLDVQQRLAFDLRTFEEMGLRLVILGVWREKNRLVQFNGDLSDRIIEIPVEPWSQADFRRVLDLGGRHLNVQFSAQLAARMFEAAFGSIAVIQELARSLCELMKVSQSMPSTLVITDESLLSAAIEERVEHYRSRHVKALEAVAVGLRDNRGKLHLHYYLVLFLLRCGVERLEGGLSKNEVVDGIRKVHPLGAGVRGNDVLALLKRLSTIQEQQKITPPILDYDENHRRLRVVDSTLFFFLKHADCLELERELAHPDPE